jgi:hypothetical protein
MRGARLEKAPPPIQIRLAAEEDRESLVSFASSFEAAHLPPASEGWTLPPSAFVLLGLYEGRLVGALRVETSRRARITHFLVTPSDEGESLAAVLLEGGMTLAREAGARMLGGFLPAGSTLIPLAQDAGAQLKACFLWVEGSLEAAADRDEPPARSSPPSIQPGPGTGHQETSQ